MSVESDPSFWQWVGGICMAIIGFFLKHLHGIVSNASSKKELTEAMKAIAVQRTEDQERAEIYRQERRDTEKLLFGRLDRQDQAIARIEGRLERVAR